MQYQAFSKDIEQYDLGDAYTLRRANPQNTDFVHHWAAYRANEAYHQDWAQRYTDLVGVPFCYWIYKHEQAIGGCLMFPNMLAELFIIPPYDDYESVMIQLLGLLRHWADESKAIHARYVLPEQVEALVKLGFQVEEQRRWMIRPTLPYEIHFDPQYTVSQSQIDEAEQYADILYAAFRGGRDEYGKRDKAQHVKSVSNFFENQAILDASSIIRDTRADDIASICLVSAYGGHATINFVVTHPQYQRQGLGKKAIQYALNQVYGKYGWMTLAVTIDNPAEKLYQTIGFAQGSIVSSLILK